MKIDVYIYIPPVGKQVHITHSYSPKAPSRDTIYIHVYSVYGYIDMHIDIYTCVSPVAGTGGREAGA